MVVARLLLVMVVIIGTHGLIGSAPEPRAAAQAEIGSEAYGVGYGEPAQPIDGSPYVALPPEGGSQADFSAGTGIGVGGGIGAADSMQVATARESGTVTSSAEIGVIELFAGLIRATNVQVRAATTVGGGGATSTGGATFGSLTVAGLSYPNPRPNERVELPGLGYVVLNEQLVGGDGRTSSSIIVRALRLQVTALIVLDVPRFTEVIVGHTSTGVPGISASRAVPSGPLPTATSVPWAPISTRDPVDVSISDRGGNDNDFDLGNGNGNTNDNGTGGGGGSGTPGTGGTQRPIVITVVIVPATATPTPTPTRTPTRTP